MSYPREFFDPVSFERDLKRAAEPLAVYKAALAAGAASIGQRFAMGAPITELVAQRTWLVDELVTRAWRQWELAGKPFALIAAGGYGRRELHPGSDVDILVLTGTRVAAKDHERMESFLRFLWDMGLEVGHS
ncbi:MAG: DUF294 nucleotidyltransferase-like domain-containing protein, partial [Pseudonocardiaceae bacterium]